MLAVLAALPAFSARVDACDCITLPPLSPAVRTETPFIFTGRVVEIVERDEHTRTTLLSGARTEVRPLDRQIVFEITSAWAGVRESRLAVSAPLDDCLFPFALGRSYLVFADRVEGRVTSNRCMRTTALDRAADILKALGKASFTAR